MYLSATLDHCRRLSRNAGAQTQDVRTMSAAPIDSALTTTKAADVVTATIDLTEPFTLGEWHIEPALRRACSGDTVVKIDPRNMRVLQILAERQGKLVSLREIESLAWEGVIVTPDSLYQSIRQLRQALRDTKSPAKYIETVPRRGYRLLAEVAAAENSDDPAPCTVEHQNAIAVQYL